VRSHHEAWDGSGYPDGLKGEDIPIAARLLTVVDCFDALASERPYRRAMPLNEAMAFVKARAGIQFDAQIVELLEKNYLELEEKARQQIEEIEPLKTDLVIHRGAAPGAGFEPEHAAKGQAESAQAAIADARRAKPEQESQTLITEASRAATVTEASGMHSGSLSAREISAMVSSCLRPLIPYDCFAVYVKSGESLLPQFVEGTGQKAFSMGQISIGAGLSGWVAENARPIVNGNPTMEPNYLAETGLLTASSSALSIPLLDQDGAVFGVLALYSAASAAFSKEHLRILEATESRFSPALQKALRFKTRDTDAKLEPALVSTAAQ
jgi:putative methionine-R-sulfoxide reductase with GAF domain